MYRGRWLLGTSWLANRKVRVSWRKQAIASLWGFECYGDVTTSLTTIGDVKSRGFVFF
jgi:hypothetical protein